MKHWFNARGWVDYARSESARDPTSIYGAHWWLIPERPGWFRASGYDGQSIIIAPQEDAVFDQLEALVDHLERLQLEE